MEKLLCCRFNKKQGGRGKLASTVNEKTRTCCGEGREYGDTWDESWFLLFFYSFFDLGLDLWSAFAVFAKYVCSAETLLALTTSILSVLIYDRYGQHLSTDMSWTLISFTVIFPLTMSITQAFVRRDDALKSLASIRGLLCNIISAHLRWNWVGSDKMYNGRMVPTTVQALDSTEEHRIQQTHSIEAQNLILELCEAIRGYLLVPRKGRARHVYTSCGQEEGKWVEWAEEVGAEKVSKLIGRLHGATETLKSKGLPPNEASRINQYLYFLTREWETIRTLKEYRTPQAMRSFSRVTIQTLPMFYGPYFLHLSKGDSMTEGNVGFACVFSGLITVFMCSLLLVQTSLENPFDTQSLDTVKIDVEIGRTRRLLLSLCDDVVYDWRSLPPDLSAQSPEELSFKHDDAQRPSDILVSPLLPQ
eukprot:TRINITY_DN21462_c0_g1_i2.p1 TRINITY_DN21462_c0_g1~~TRINITY_DN21462_c0_g1_i2.p1  ORF type:complete len:418 (+),score=46.92 TRINITY_DN21462_c0_g1_i2:572-1825(+)